MMATKKRASMLDEFTPAKARPEEAVPAKVENDEPKKTVTLRLSGSAWEALKLLAFEKRSTAHAVLVEGLNAMLVKNGKPPIA